MAVFETVKAAQDGTLAGGFATYDLKVDGVGYSTSGGYLDDIVAQLEEIKAAIISGEITVPTIENWDEKFGLTTRAMQTEESIVRVAREWVLEAAADGVFILRPAVAMTQLIPEAADLEYRVVLFPNLRAVNIAVKGLLGRGVSENALLDPQAKGLGEYVRARAVDVPISILDGVARAGDGGG